MASEKYLSRGHTAIWSAVLPDLDFRHLQPLLDDPATLTRFCEPFRSDAPACYNDLVAEMAFGSWAHRELSGNRNEAGIARETVEAAILRIRTLSGKSLRRDDLPAQIFLDARELRNRLEGYFIPGSDPACFHPRLRGVGILDTCHPDVLWGRTLVEVKSSGYGFRLQDFRQLFLYAFLCRANQVAIDSLSLVNPRRGVAFRMPVHEFCRRFGRRRPGVLFPDLEKLLSEFSMQPLPDIERTR